VSHRSPQPLAQVGFARDDELGYEVLVVAEEVRRGVAGDPSEASSAITTTWPWARTPTALSATVRRRTTAASRRGPLVRAPTPDSINRQAIARSGAPRRRCSRRPRLGQMQLACLTGKAPCRSATSRPRSGFRSAPTLRAPLRLNREASGHRSGQPCRGTGLGAAGWAAVSTVRLDAGLAARLIAGSSRGGPVCR
jgi:hypothetical protein